MKMNLPWNSRVIPAQATLHIRHHLPLENQEAQVDQEDHQPLQANHLGQVDPMVPMVLVDLMDQAAPTAHLPPRENQVALMAQVDLVDQVARQQHQENLEDRMVQVALVALEDHHPPLESRGDPTDQEDLMGPVDQEDLQHHQENLEVQADLEDHQHRQDSQEDQMVPMAPEVQMDPLPPRVSLVVLEDLVAQEVLMAHRQVPENQEVPVVLEDQMVLVAQEVHPTSHQVWQEIRLMRIHTPSLLTWNIVRRPN